MNELPVPFTTVQLVWSLKLNEYIEEQFGRPWSIGQNGKHGQEEIVTFEVWQDPEATRIVEEWLASPPAKIPGRLNQLGVGEDIEITTDEILNELCNRGLFPAGDLTVHVWW